MSASMNNDESKEGKKTITKFNFDYKQMKASDDAVDEFSLEEIRARCYEKQYSFERSIEAKLEAKYKATNESLQKQNELYQKEIESLKNQLVIANTQNNATNSTGYFFFV